MTPYITLLMAVVLAFQATPQTTPSNKAPATAPAAVPNAAPANNDELENPNVTALAYALYAGISAGHVDAMLVTPELERRLSTSTSVENRAAFAKLGAPTRLTVERRERSRFAIRYEYLATFADTQRHMQLYINPDGKVCDFIFSL